MQGKWQGRWMKPGFLVLNDGKIIPRLIQKVPGDGQTPAYVISNGIRRLSPHIQTNPPLEPPTNSILPTCGSNISASPELISTISTASSSSRKDLSSDL